MSACKIERIVIPAKKRRPRSDILYIGLSTSKRRDRARRKYERERLELGYRDYAGPAERLLRIMEEAVRSNARMMR